MKGKPAWSSVLCATSGPIRPWLGGINKSVVMWDGAVLREESLLTDVPSFNQR